MANDVNRVSPSKYDIYEKLLDIAKNYTDTENTDYLKRGLCGNPVYGIQLGQGVQCRYRQINSSIRNR